MDKIFDVPETGSDLIIRIGATLEGFTDPIINDFAKFVNEHNNFTEMRMLVSKDYNAFFNKQESQRTHEKLNKIREKINRSFKISVRFLKFDFHSVLFSLDEFNSLILLPLYKEYNKEEFKYNWGIFVHEDGTNPTNKKIIEKNNKIFDDMWGNLSIITHEKQYIIIDGEYHDRESWVLLINKNEYQHGDEKKFLCDYFDHIYDENLLNHKIAFELKEVKDE